jgi:hypothetical protein
MRIAVISLLLLAATGLVGASGMGGFPTVPMMTATLSAQPVTYKGACPKTINFSGSIDGPIGWEVTYYFSRTIRAVVTTTTPSTALIGATGHLSVDDAISVDAAHDGAGSDELDVASTSVTAVASFKVACVATTAL